MPLRDEDLVKLVTVRMAPLASGRPMLSFARLRQHELKGDVPGIETMSDVTLGREFIRAFRRKLVGVQRQTVHEPPRRVEPLEDELQRAFGSHGLSTVVVVEKGDESAVPVDLGLAGAEYLTGKGRLRPQERLGIAGGQTIGWTSTFVRDRGGITARDITFVSLSGILGARQRGPEAGQNVFIDADINAIRMAQGVADHVDFLLVGTSAVRPQGRTRAGASWLNAHDRDRLRPPRALVGVGVLHDSWRLFDAVHARDPDHPFHRDLRRLHRLCAQVERKSSRGLLWSPVYDVAHRLFVAEPRDGCGLSPHVEKNVRELVGRLNRALVTVDERDFGQMRLWVVAGGARKSYALFDVLTRPPFVVETLITDDQTARALLALVANRAVHAPRSARPLARSRRG